MTNPAAAETCANCKFWVRNDSTGIKSSWDEYNQYGRCHSSDVNDFLEHNDYASLEPKEDFGCNKFEAKEI